MQDKYLTVTALTRYIKRKIGIDPHLKDVWLRGEISNFKHHSRGHMYLTIKDDNSRVQSVMFAGNNRFLKFRPENGMKVLIKGEIGVFEPHGQYQLYIKEMEPDGVGALYLAFEQLKEKLLKQGYFDQNNKKTIPRIPKHIGVITSPTGAAVRDIITTINRRFPIVKVTVIPVMVQGTASAASIRDAIQTANKLNDFDLLIVGRGGGSIEELWSFNEEMVADAIYKSSIPIISAVGHETDTTISDYVADLRAPTPTGAAEIAVPSQIELTEKIHGLRRNMIRTMDEKIRGTERHLDRIKQSYAFRYPGQLLTQKEQELDRQVDRLKNMVSNKLTRDEDILKSITARLTAQHPERQIKRAFKEISHLNKRYNIQMTKLFDQKQTRFRNTIEKLSLLNPLEVMKRGYALPYNQTGELIRSTSNVNKNDQITVKVSDGALACRVLEIEEEFNG